MPWQPDTTRAGSRSLSKISISSGSRTSRNATATTLNSSTVSHITAPSSAAATIHTSVLMKRNVMNSSSSGSARVTSGNSSPRLPRVRLPAQRAIEPARSVVSA